MTKDMDVNYEDYHKLTPQQQRFCDEYLVHFNAFKAALAAGYSDNTARRGDLVHLPKIQLYLRGAMNRTQQRLQITQDMILHELAKVAFSNMANYYDEYDALKPLSQLTNDQKAAISHYEVLDSRDEEGYRAGKFGRIKLHNKMAALDKIARHIGFYGVVGASGSSSGSCSRDVGFSPEVGKTESPEESGSGSSTGSREESGSSSGSREEVGFGAVIGVTECSFSKEVEESRDFDNLGDGTVIASGMESPGVGAEPVVAAAVDDGKLTERATVVDGYDADENGGSEHYFADGVEAAELDDADGGPATGRVRGWLPVVDGWATDDTIACKVSALAPAMPLTACVVLCG